MLHSNWQKQILLKNITYWLLKILQNVLQEE